MGIFAAAFDSIGGMLADQWKDIVTAGDFDEYTLVAPGVRKNEQNGYGANCGSEDILSTGSIIFVPENTAAFVFSQSGIEQVITEPGGYEYRDGEPSVFDKQNRQEQGIGKILFDQAASRVGFSGMPGEEKRVAFINLREIRGIKFGTRGPLAYNDLHYGTDLEIFSYGTFSVQVTDPVRLVRNYIPANTASYSFRSLGAREQLVAEFLHSFIVAVNALSAEYRISQLPAQANSIVSTIRSEGENAGTWDERFGLKLVSVAVENIEFSDDSRELIRQYSEKKMNVAAYEGVSKHAADVAAQQMIAEGVRDNGLGEGGGMLFGMNLASSLSPRDASAMAGASSASGMHEQGAQASLDAQIEAIKKLKELLDAGILSQEEFDAKKREVLGL